MTSDTDMPDNIIKIKVTTELWKNDDGLHLDLVTDLAGNISKKVAALEERAMIDALVHLGWTPPSERANAVSQSVDVEGLKKHVPSIDHTFYENEDIAYERATAKSWNDCIDHLAREGYLRTPQPGSALCLSKNTENDKQTDLSIRDEKQAAEALAKIIKNSYSHVNGRDLFAELKHRKTLDIKKRVDRVETWHEGDWLSDLGEAIREAEKALSNQTTQKGTTK